MAEAKKSSRPMKHRWLAEQRKYRIIHATKWSKGGGIEVKSRLVVLAFTPVLEHRDNFALRWQNEDGATWGGSAFTTNEQAHNAFLRRYLEHNATYRAGNISHLPGIVK
jgi:hypothetical protein